MHKPVARDSFGPDGGRWFNNHETAGGGLEGIKVVSLTGEVVLSDGGAPHQAGDRTDGNIDQAAVVI